jgi:signal peptidase I
MEETNELLEQTSIYKEETMEKRRVIKRRLPWLFAVIILHRIMFFMDKYAVFNPTRTVFIDLILAFCLALGLTFLIIDYRAASSDYETKQYNAIYKGLAIVFEYIVIVPYLVFVITVVNMFFFSFSPIAGSSMEPSFSDHEAVIFNHQNHTYNRYDVVIVYEETLSEPLLIKRVIGLPGEHIVIDNSDIYVDGTLLTEPFLDKDQVKTYCVNGTNPNYCEFDIGQGEYFVLGDNRDGRAIDDAVNGYSIDSRTFGPVHFDNLYGRVIIQFSDYDLFE